jgi:hypothetical protein
MNNDTDIISYKTIHIKPKNTFNVDVIVISREKGTIKHIDRTLIED